MLKAELKCKLAGSSPPRHIISQNPSQFHLREYNFLAALEVLNLAIRNHSVPLENIPATMVHAIKTVQAIQSICKKAKMNTPHPLPPTKEKKHLGLFCTCL